MGFKRTFRICVWTVIGIACLCFFAYTVYNRIAHYISIPTRIAVRMDQRDQAQFPGFTFCASTKEPFRCKYISGGRTSAQADLGSCDEYGRHVTQVGGVEGICGQFKEKFVGKSSPRPVLMIEYNKTATTPPKQAIIQFANRLASTHTIDFKSTNGLLLSNFEQYNQLKNCDLRGSSPRKVCEMRLKQDLCGSNKTPCSDQWDFTQYYPIDFKACVGGAKGEMLRQCWEEASVGDRCGPRSMEACVRKYFTVSEVSKESLVRKRVVVENTWSFAIGMDQNEVKVYKEYFAETLLSMLNNIGMDFNMLLFISFILWLLTEAVLFFIVKLCLNKGAIRKEKKSLEQRVRLLESMMQEDNKKKEYA